MTEDIVRRLKEYALELEKKKSNSIDMRAEAARMLGGNPPKDPESRNKLYRSEISDTYLDALKLFREKFPEIGTEQK